MNELTFTEVEARIARVMRDARPKTFRKADLLRAAPEVSGRTVARALARLVTLGVVVPVAETTPTLYRWAPRTGTGETVRRLSIAITAFATHHVH